LNSRLDISSVINLFSRSSNSLSSGSFSSNRFSGNGSSSFVSISLSIKFDSFGVINDFFVVNRLSVVLLSRNGIVSSGCISLNSGLSSNRFVIYNSVLSSINVNFMFNSFNSWLNNSFSIGNLSRNINVHGFSYNFVINNRISSNSLCVDRSVNDSSSFNRSLNDSLSNDRLRNNGLSYDRLRDDLFGNNRFGFNSLSLGNSRLGVVYIGTELFIGLHLSSILPLSSSNLSRLLPSKFPVSSTEDLGFSRYYRIFRCGFRDSSKGFQGYFRFSINGYVVSGSRGCGEKLRVSSFVKLSV